MDAKNPFFFFGLKLRTLDRSEPARPLLSSEKVLRSGCREEGGRYAIPPTSDAARRPPDRKLVSDADRRPFAVGPDRTEGTPKGEGLVEEC